MAAIDDLPTVPEGYEPSETEAFMNPTMRAYFKARLLSWKQELLDSSAASRSQLAEETLALPEIGDRASIETEKTVEFRTQDRARKLIAKIDSALRRIDLGTYGYCDETDEPIGIKRLIARPVATLTVEAQAEKERRERIHRDS